MKILEILDIGRLLSPRGLSGAWRGKFGFRKNREYKAATNAPQGAAVPVATGVWGHQPTSYIFWGDFQGKSWIGTSGALTHALPPLLWQPRIAKVTGEGFCDLKRTCNGSLFANAPCPTGDWWRKKGGFISITGFIQSEDF